MFDALVDNARQKELIFRGQEKLDDASKKELFQRLDENMEQFLRAMDEGGFWDVFMVLELSSPLEIPAPESVQPEKDPGKDFEEQRALLAKDSINLGSVSDRDIQDLKWATSHGEGPRAEGIFSVVLKNVEAVEATVGRKGVLRPLAWAGEHRTDPRARCIVEMLDRWRKKSKADLARMDAFAKQRR